MSRYRKAAPAGVPARRVHAVDLAADQSVALCGTPAWPFPADVDFDPLHPLACRSCSRLAR
jgi:hypothetical protein